MLKAVTWWGLALVLLSAELSACSWCTKTATQHASSLQELLATKETGPKLAPAQNPDEHKTNDTSKEVSEKKHDFDREYLRTYFPKALVIVEDYFLVMCADGIEKSLVHVTNLLGSKAWYWYRNKPDHFALGEYWENILEVCKIIKEFLRDARVSLKDKSVILPWNRSYSSYADADEEYQPLLSYWKAEGRTEYYDFYAFMFDYQVKMFNEGIRFNDLKQSNRYSREMELTLDKLRGSTYESTYREVMTTSKELILLLKQRLGLVPHKGGGTS